MGWGSFTQLTKGWGSKSSFPPSTVRSLLSNPSENILYAPGCPRNWVGYLARYPTPLGVLEKFVQNESVLIFRPLDIYMSTCESGFRSTSAASEFVGGRVVRTDERAEGPTRSSKATLVVQHETIRVIRRKLPHPQSPVHVNVTWKENSKHKEIGWTPPLGIATIPWTCPVCPMEMSRLSRGHSIQSMWNYTEIRSGRPRCPGDSPPNLRGIRTTKFLHSGTEKSSNCNESSEAFPRIFWTIRTFYSQNEDFRRDSPWKS